MRRRASLFATFMVVGAACIGTAAPVRAQQDVTQRRTGIALGFERFALQISTNYQAFEYVRQRPSDRVLADAANKLLRVIQEDTEGQQRAIGTLAEITPESANQQINDQLGTVAPSMLEAIQKLGGPSSILRNGRNIIIKTVSDLTSQAVQRRGDAVPTFGLVQPAYAQASKANCIIFLLGAVACSVAEQASCTITMTVSWLNCQFS